MTKEEKEHRKILKIAFLVSLASVLQIFESLIPHPIPGLRLGLANVITLIALVDLGFKAALEVALLRSILSAFIMGTFMSPVFILSFSGALISTLVMGFLFWLSGVSKYARPGIVGISVLGALAHNIVQLFLAYLILIRNPGVFIFLPWLAIGSVVTGWITGVAAGSACREIKERQSQIITQGQGSGRYPPFKFNYYIPGKSFLHCLSSRIKISGVIFLSLVTLFSDNLWFLLGLFLLLSLITLISGISFNTVFLKIKKFSTLIVSAFFLPLLFNSGTHVLGKIAFLKITSEGVCAGEILAFRIIILILANSLLNVTTPPEEMAKGLTKVLSAFRFLGISGKRTAAIFSLSWQAIPLFWEITPKIIKEANFRKIRDPRKLIPCLSDIITSLYLEASFRIEYCV